MAGKARIATAACLMVSGLLVTGGSAALAFANPDDGGPAPGVGTTAGNSEGSSTAQPADTSGAGPTATPGGTTGAAGVSGPSTKPTSTVGNGRTGPEPTPTGGAEGAAGTDPDSNEPEGDPDGTESTGETEPGKSAEESLPDGDLDGEITDDLTGGTGQSDPAPTAGSPAVQTPALPAITDLQTIVPAILGVEPTEGGPLAGARQAIGSAAVLEEPVPAASRPWAWWNWSYLSWPTPDGDGGGGNGALPTSPIFNLPAPPPMLVPLLQIPTQLLWEIHGIAQPIFTAVTGLATAAAQLPFAQLATLPLIVVPPEAGLEAPGGSAGSGGAIVPAPHRINPPAAPEPQVTAPNEKVTPPPPARQRTSPTATAVSNDLLPAPTYRMGYVDYLRAAGLGEVAAVAVPGVTGILVLTSAGGLIGYRQARAGRAVHAGGPARFIG